MKASSALIFCIGVILLMYLSGAINKKKPDLMVLEPVVLYDSMTCMQACTEHKVLGNVEKGDILKVLSRIKGKTRIILRVESKDSAGWTEYDETKMQYIGTDNTETENK